MEIHVSNWDIQFCLLLLCTCISFLLHTNKDGDKPIHQAACGNKEEILQSTNWKTSFVVKYEWSS